MLPAKKSTLKDKLALGKINPPKEVKTSKKSLKVEIKKKKTSKK